MDLHAFSHAGIDVKANSSLFHNKRDDSLAAEKARSAANREHRLPNHRRQQLVLNLAWQVSDIEHLASIYIGPFRKVTNKNDSVEDHLSLDKIELLHNRPGSNHADMKMVGILVFGRIERPFRILCEVVNKSCLNLFCRQNLIGLG